MTEVSNQANKHPKAPALKLEITQELIDTAQKGDSGYCMIAEAVKAAFPDAPKSVSVDLQTIRFSDPARRLRYIYLTPRPAQKALVDFDQGVEVAPFSILLRGGHVTKMARRSEITAETRAKIQQQAVAREERKRATMLRSIDSSGGSVPERIGGAPPPLQKTRDGVPFSRRREFGLRALSR